ncbi:protein of unknown function DUF214 [Alkaliphilus metalliredigens QYMF]|uniref:ABC3 transporter permease C-terminal domain-containing protein n=1 Tax=Alkaliphilus metalliredigens (strain QYMF) TaxID=293826 RepID=A6TKV8_ALKMQ|nr:FtsX-like permease family protein [Alkaliphilus metalliredigens]ABR46826.1 protein of unknown function DUF214 [Alkaliphilus metalliredigens QYMF]
MKKLDVRLLRMIKNTKGQFISIVVVIILALTIYGSFNMMADNMGNTISHYYEITNFGDVFVEVVRIPRAAIDQLTTIEGVEVAQGRVTADVPLRVEDPNEKVNVRIVSLPREDYRINELYTIEGREMQEDVRTTVVLEQFSEARGIQLGDQITPYIAGREYPLEMIGIVGSPEYIYLMENQQSLLPTPERFGVIYVTEEFAQSVLGFQGSYNEVMIKIEDEHLDRIDSITDEIEDQLDRYGVRRTIKREDQLSNSMMMEEVSQLDQMATSVPLLFLVVAAVIINIMLSRIVKNDRMAIGVMKALGYGNFNIMGHYVKYALAIGLVGAVIGIIFSVFLSQAFTNLYIQFFNIPLLQMDVYYIYVLYGLILTSVFCIVSGLIGARSVLRILPADSMKPEAPKAGGRILLEKVKFIWNRISFSWKMVIRNILRNKKRGIFLVLGIALTFGITMLPIFMTSVWGNLFTIHYGEFQTMEYNVDFAHPMNDNAIRELQQIIDVDHIEPKIEIPFELRNGWRKQVVSVIAVPRDTRFYHFTSPSKQSINLDTRGMIITEGIARSLGAQIGDEILLKSFMPDQEDQLIRVSGITQQLLGSNGYMDIETMNDVLGERGIITGALIDSQDDVSLKLQDVKNISLVQSVEDMKNSFEEFMEMMIYSVSILMLFGGILGFAIVYNTTIISISERIMEFSSLRVLGFEKNEIYKMISRENAVMTVLGIAVGVPVGYGMCYGIVSAFETDLYKIPLIITPSSYVFAAMMTAFFVAIAQLATIRKIYKMNFIDALKNRIS